MVQVYISQLFSIFKTVRGRILISCNSFFFHSRRRSRDIFFEYTKINGERSKEKQGDVLLEPEERLKEKEKAADKCMLDSFD